ncbi:hypothetical protein M413DRAFT_445174 [Hebeloma cylindrosporum]|uniref:Uncharacterized protein n=1 Tax=Hebeloma cylindrosporum TaxID=76867 RepID=A0A0C3CCK7_HEBCY|nr:hypothetical protein M413DRAFT_445174 [Hebeloma cylindrosporum h7]
MAAVHTASTLEKNTAELDDYQIVEPKTPSANSQPEEESEPRGFIELVPFDSTRAGVDPAELVGKVFVNAYHISANPDDEGTGLPGSFGIEFTDGSKYHIRIYNARAAGEFADVNIDIENGFRDEDDLEGKRVTAASLLRHEDSFIRNYGYNNGEKNHGLVEYVVLGIKLEGFDEWVRFSGGTEEVYLDEEVSKVVIDSYDVYLVRMKGARVKKGRPKKY